MFEQLILQGETGMESEPVAALAATISQTIRARYERIPSSISEVA